MYTKFRKINPHRKDRLICVDKETGYILKIEGLSFESDGRTRLVVSRKSMYPRFGKHLFPEEKGKSCAVGYAYQFLDKVDLYVVKPKKQP